MTLKGERVDGSVSTQEAADTEMHSRDNARDSMFLQATLRPLSGGNPPAFSVRVRNLSAGGLMADADAEVAVDDRITIDLRNIGQVEGRVAWVRGQRFGVTFDVAIDPKLARKPAKSGAVQPIINGSGYHRTTHLLG